MNVISTDQMIFTMWPLCHVMIRSLKLPEKTSIMTYIAQEMWTVLYLQVCFISHVISFVDFQQNISTLRMYVATFRLHTASLHQATRWTGYAKPYKPLCSAVIGWFSTAVIGAFRSSLFRRVVLSAVRLFTALLLFCFLIVGIHASGISIPLSLLMLWVWSLLWIASFILQSKRRTAS